MTTRDARAEALQSLQQHQVLMVDGHFDFGNGYHGSAYVNPHQLLRQPSTIWGFAQDLLDVIPAATLERVEVVAGPMMGGAILAHTIAGLLDSRRALSGAPLLFAPFQMQDGQPTLSRFYQAQLAGKRVLVVDDVRNTGQTLVRCVELAREAGATVLATCVICDRLNAVADAGVENIALVEYGKAPRFPAADCPLCLDGKPVTAF